MTTPTNFERAHTANLAAYVAYSSRSGRATEKAIEKMRRSFPLSQADTLARMLRDRGQFVTTAANVAGKERR